MALQRIPSHTYDTPKKEEEEEEEEGSSSNQKMKPMRGKDTNVEEQAGKSLKKLADVQTSWGISEGSCQGQ